jgi:alpha-amylase
MSGGPWRWARLALSMALLGAPLAPAAMPPRARPSHEIFYQIFVRSFRDSNGDRIGDLRGITAKLGYLQHLGITSILLTPLQPSPFYHNYFASRFTGIDPAYGTMADYFAFVHAAHELGLKVYLDEEFQYVAQGNPWWRRARAHPYGRYGNDLLWRNRARGIAEPFLNRAKWQDYDGRSIGIAMVNLNDPAVRRYFRRLLLFWADPPGHPGDGVDGFRIDHMMDNLDHQGLETHLFSRFWAPLFRALKARRAHLRILAEQAGWGYGHRWLTRGHADMVFAFPLRAALVSLRKRRIVEAIRATAAATPPGKAQVLLLENQDTDRYMSAVGDSMARARAGAAIELVLKGEPLIYYGQELGMRGRVIAHDLNDEAQIPAREAFRWRNNLLAPGSAIWYRSDPRVWQHRYNRSDDGVSLQAERANPQSLYHWYRKLIALHRSRPELNGGQEQLVCPRDPRVLCVLRREGAQRTLLEVNLGHTVRRPRIERSALSGVHWSDLLHGGSAHPHAPLRPLEVRILGTT